MENKYSEDFLNNGLNSFQDIMEGENPQYTMPERLSSCFHVLTSMINDASVPDELKSRILSMWKETMDNNASKMLPEHLAQNDKYLSDMILGIDSAETNVNVLDLATGDEMKYDMMNSIKNQVEANDFNTTLAIMKSYSHVNDDVFKIATEDDGIELGAGSIGDTPFVNEEAGLDNINHKEIIDNFTDEEQQIMLKNFIATNDLIVEARKNPDLDEDWANDFKDLPDDLAADINRTAMLAEQHLETLPKMEVEASSEPKVVKDEVEEAQKEEEQKQKEQDKEFEYDVDAEKDAKRQKAALMENNNLIKQNRLKNKVPLLTSTIYSYDPDVYDPEALFNNLGRGPALMKVNNVTGSSTIPPSSFDKREAFDLAMLNLVEKGKKDVYLTPPKKGGAQAQKQFLEQAITAAMETGHFDPDNIHVPKKWKKFKNSLVESLQGAKISDEMNKDDMNHDYGHDNDIDYKPTPEIDENPDAPAPEAEAAPEMQESLPENNAPQVEQPAAPMPDNQQPTQDPSQQTNQPVDPYATAAAATAAGPVVMDTVKDYQDGMPDLLASQPEPTPEAQPELPETAQQQFAADDMDQDFLSSFDQSEMEGVNNNLNNGDVPDFHQELNEIAKNTQNSDSSTPRRPRKPSMQ